MSTPAADSRVIAPGLLELHRGGREGGREEGGEGGREGVCVWCVLVPVS